MTKIRLQKIIADAGIASRREAEKLIQEGCVTVNGKLITELGFKADPLEDAIKVNGKLIKKPENLVYIAFNKPKMVMCTTSDPEGRQTIYDIIGSKVKERVFPVGRLDYHSEGLILLTNDGELALRLTHPKHKVDKVYEVKVKDVPDEEKLDKLRKGIYLEEGKTLPCQISFIKKTKENCWLSVILKEGKRQQIRRMFMRIGHPVMKLKRVAIGPLKLGKLPIGSFRYLTEKEVSQLKKATGL